MPCIRFHPQTDFERESLPPFRYQAKNGKRAVMSYRMIPQRLYDDPDELARWAERALAAALRKAAIGRKSPARDTRAKRDALKVK